MSIERLRESLCKCNSERASREETQQKAETEQHENGFQDGRKWAADEASADDLISLDEKKDWLQLTPLYGWLGTKRFRAHDSCAYKRGFAAGALAYWHEVKPQVIAQDRD